MTCTRGSGRKEEVCCKAVLIAHHELRIWRSRMYALEAQLGERSRHDGPLVELRGLDIVFDEHPVLRGIDLSIPHGQTLAVVGESGCGKTVLLKSIIGLLKPTRGEVRFDGKDLAKLTDHQLTRERARYGFVFQGAALFDSMTVGQNISFPLHEHTTTGEHEIREIVVSRLAEVGLPESVITKKPAELSGGMRKRVGLARALALYPELMLYDEPTTGLDPIMSDVINELMVRARDQHPVTSVVVTHDMRTARKVADRAIMLYPLSRLAAGEPQIIYDGPANQIDQARDVRVTQFVNGEAGERLMELRRAADLKSTNGI
jgi:phospholipid/cholesterol/gamma-HCH transport system ATP-binding protein